VRSWLGHYFLSLLASAVYNNRKSYLSESASPHQWRRSCGVRGQLTPMLDVGSRLYLWPPPNNPWQVLTLILLYETETHFITENDQKCKIQTTNFSKISGVLSPNPRAGRGPPLPRHPRHSLCFLIPNILDVPPSLARTLSTPPDAGDANIDVHGNSILRSTEIPPSEGPGTNVGYNRKFVTHMKRCSKSQAIMLCWTTGNTLKAMRYRRDYYSSLTGLSVR